MHQSIMTKMKNYSDKDWTMLEVIIKHGIKTFECQYKDKKWEKQVIFVQTKLLLLENIKNNC